MHDRAQGANAPRRYSLAERIASGGMADVFLARDNLLNRSVVVKRIKPDVEEDPAFVGMFMDEARTIAQFNHPHIVRIYDIGFDGPLPFMAMEWLNGWDLRTIMRHLRKRKEQLDLGIAVRLLIDACRGLHAAHVACTDDGVPLRLVHRDVSPQNLFVTVDGVLKLLDFGIAKTAIQRNRTREGELKGKFAYMSPEQFEGAPIDRRADVFSLGVILHEMITGRGLFGHLDPHECYRAVTSEPVSVPQREGERVPEELCSIAVRALERDAAGRFASAELLSDALEDMVLRHGLRRTHDEVSRYLAELFSKPGDQSSRPGRVWTTPPTAPSGRTDTEDLEGPDTPTPFGASDTVPEPPALPPAPKAAPPAAIRPRTAMPTKAARGRMAATQLRKSSGAWILLAAAIAAGVALWHAVPQAKERDNAKGTVASTAAGDAQPAGQAALAGGPSDAQAPSLTPSADAPATGDDESDPDQDVLPALASEQSSVETRGVAAAGQTALLAPAEASDEQEVEVPAVVPGGAVPVFRGGRVFRRTPRGRYVKIALRWSRVPGAQAYQVQVSRKRDFTKLAVDLEVTGTSATKKRVRAAGIYFCRVRAKAAGRYGPFSTVFELKPGKHKRGRRAGGHAGFLDSPRTAAAGVND